MNAYAPSIFTPAATAMIQKLCLKKSRANLEDWADTLQALSTVDRNVIAATSDSRGSGRLAPFDKALPEQIVEAGIAEQNLVGITAGLAPRFKIVGFPDEDSVTGAQADLFRHYGISMEGLAANARELPGQSSNS